LGASTVSGTYSVIATASGGITQTGALAVTGVSTFQADTSNDITLTTATNNFVAAVGITSGRNVALTDAGAIVLGASTVSGTYSVIATASGGITQTGALAVTGVSTFQACVSGHGCFDLSSGYFK